MTLTGRMKLGFGALVVIAAMLVGLNVSEMLWVDYTQTSIDEQEERTRVANQMMAYVDSLDRDITYVNDAAAQGGAVGQLQESYEADAAALSTLVDTALQSAGTAPEDAATLESMKDVLDQYRLAADQLFETVRLRSTETASPLFAATSLGVQLGEIAAPYAEKMMGLLDAKQARLGFIASLCLILTAVLGAVAVAGGILFSWILSRKIRGTLKAAVSDIGGAASQLRTVAAQASAGAAQTAASTSETMATVEEVKQAAVLAQQKASEIADTSEGVAHISEAGQGMVEGTNASIEAMRNKIDVVFEAVGSLNERSQAAGEVIAAVNDLAEQSNLLSVNASIEAAKAGDYGKGFTVVAQEVKSLAEQSKQATAYARTILSEIQKAGNTAVRAAEEGREAVDAGRRQSLETGELIQTLAGRAAEVAQAQAQISATSRQQLGGMERIAKAIESIDQASDQSLEGTRQVDQEIARLQDLALRLGRLVQSESME